LRTLLASEPSGRRAGIYLLAIAAGVLVMGLANISYWYDGYYYYYESSSVNTRRIAMDLVEKNQLRQALQQNDTDIGVGNLNSDRQEATQTQYQSPPPSSHSVKKNDVALKKHVPQPGNVSEKALKDDSLAFESNKDNHHIWKFDAKDDDDEGEDDLCASLMGNGFDEEIPICSSTALLLDSNNNNKHGKHGGGEIMCRRNPTTRATMCQAKNTVVDPTKIKVALGGEIIHHVAGRKEAEEMPIY
jgi:hypothetical protein